ncbi:hypothetical protein MKZ38_000653 [Zalerion maritima]|uniref:ERF1 methyltransferase catalytic subunit MTQ2 n=1 Tax=Zalerion maritima TaxID=339359 RepID=A0AAD5RF26_9PEZI|nr:hypothetical protein MKZ38_000653 [Zalerion maritima]
MLPTPDTSHVPYTLVYEPAEDSFLLLDTLSSPSEVSFLSSHFSPFPATTTTISSPRSQPQGAPLVLEVGSGSGVVTAFLTANAGRLFGHAAVLTLSTDVNVFACSATAKTTTRACAGEGERQRSSGTTDGDGNETENDAGPGAYLASLRADLATPFLPGSVDVLVFNPPYVPTPSVPRRMEQRGGPPPRGGGGGGGGGEKKPGYEEEIYLLELSYAGGDKGMEVTDRLLDSLPEVLSPRGCAYVLMCAQNKPQQVRERIRRWDAGRDDSNNAGNNGARWMAETVGSSGKKAGWEKLEIVRIWREFGKVGDK